MCKSQSRHFNFFVIAVVVFRNVEVSEKMKRAIVSRAPKKLNKQTNIVRSLGKQNETR